VPAGGLSAASAGRSGGRESRDLQHIDQPLPHVAALHALGMSGGARAGQAPFQLQPAHQALQQRRVRGRSPPKTAVGLVKTGLEDRNSMPGVSVIALTFSAISKTELRALDHTGPAIRVKVNRCKTGVGGWRVELNKTDCCGQRSGRHPRMTSLRSQRGENPMKEFGAFQQLAEAYRTLDLPLSNS